MSDTPFKTPLSHHKYQKSRHATPSYTPQTMSEKSDSEESTASEGSSAYTGSSDDLTVVAMFDDLIRLVKYQHDNKLEESFTNFAEETKKLFGKYCEMHEECERLRNMLDLKTQDCAETERRLKTARVILDKEKKNTHKVLKEKEELEEQLEQVRDLLFKDNKVRIGEEAKEKLSFLHRTRYSTEPNGFNINNNLSCIQEINSTGSMLSDFSVSRSEDDLDVSRTLKGGKGWKKHRPSAAGDLDPPQKKRRSSSKMFEVGPQDTVRATTTVTVTKKGPIRATSVIESIPRTEETNSNERGTSSDDGIGSTAPSAPPPHLVFEAWEKQSTPGRNTQTKSDLRQHTLQQKTMVMPDSCVCCEKRIRFGKTALKCKECRSLCHYECKDQLRLPCVPTGNTPSNKNVMSVISDYTPTSAPMVPALIVHCTNEIESRGLNELGLYRVSASEKDVKVLKEKFLKGRGAPSISQTDVHTLCGVVKDFIRSLAEPLTTYALWPDFVAAVEAKDPIDVLPSIYQCISALPQPNRDTLAYLVLHLQKVAESPECKMPIENLAKVFGPTLVGFSSDNPNPDSLLTELRLQIAVVEQLIRLPADYWLTFVNVANQQQQGSRMQQTPSTDSLLRPNGRFFTPSRARSARKRRFETPPAYKID
ncbi:rac GTPase-activating protein 1-like isoform X2 [Anthonomus grandis grandis]|uniref:rac GTPase-activating protein 1-like isoform X2 n=1 Tax=Anthonomus grandis grandis TaxID=2921223 RepID=UPI002165B9DE|nr:rac GTPase-activating protein 1-like isoform X2 [Anthonomus grandis grandis]